MSWLDDMFSLMRNFERIAKENEQFLNMCEQNAKHLNAIASSSAIQMAEAAQKAIQEQIPHSTIAELIERQESLAKTIESLSHSPMAQLRSYGNRINALGKPNWAEFRPPDSGSLGAFRRIVVTHSPDEVNQYLQLGWVIVDCKLHDNDSARPGIWMLGWYHDDDPQELETQE